MPESAKSKLNTKLLIPTSLAVGNRIKNLIDLKKLTQKEVAEKLDITEATLSRYITGQRKPTGDTLIQLSNILETTTDYILKGEKETANVKPLKVDKDIKLKLNTIKKNNSSNSTGVDLSTLPKLDIIGLSLIHI